MSVLDRSALEASPLADLHALASELSIDGYRRLRKAELIDAILVRQGGEADAGEEPPVEADEDERPGGRRRRGRRGGRGRGAQREDETDAPPESESAPAPEEVEEDLAENVVEDLAEVEEQAERADGGRRGGAEREEEIVEGEVELLPNGSG